MAVGRATLTVMGVWLELIIRVRGVGGAECTVL